MTTEDARKIVAELEARLAAGTAREIELATEGRRLAYAAETGDDGAKKVLVKLDAEDVKLRQTQLHLRDAIDEGQHRLAQAQHEEEMSALRTNAHEVMSLAEQAAKRGPRIRDLAQVLCDEIQATFVDARRFGSLGAPVVNQRLLMLAMTRTILAQLRDAGLDVQIIAPGDRHPLDELVASFVGSSTRWAATVLGEKVGAA
jgi:dGTP triphosphohydrolase